MKELRRVIIEREYEPGKGEGWLLDMVYSDRGMVCFIERDDGEIVAVSHERVRFKFPYSELEMEKRR